MESTQAQLDGGEIFQWELGIDGSGPKKPGRPPLIETSVLLRRRDELFAAIEEHWAEFAWDLRRAKSISSIRRALQSLHARREFELFVSEPTQFATWNGVRKTRHEAASLLGSLRKAIGEERREQERLDSVLNALKDSGPDERLEQLSDKRKQDHASAVALIRELTRRHEEISEVLRRREAYICQFELLDFLTSERYALAPSSLANAMAGLPLIAWRQSIKRCAENIRRNGGTLSYQIFEEVTRALDGPPQTASRAVAQVRTHLARKRRKPSPAILMLKDDFYYLRVSIEAVYSQKPPRSAIPFRVSAEYFRRSATRNPYDQLIAEEDRL